MSGYHASRFISQMCDEEFSELVLLIIRKHRIEIQIVLERAAKSIGDEEFLRRINSLRPRSGE